MSREYDKPKRSWREIDQDKDRSAHRRDDRQTKNPFKKARSKSASAIYRHQLDSFFDGSADAPKHIKEKFSGLSDSQEGKARKAAAAGIVNARNSRARDEAVEAFLEKFTLPPDYQVLQAVLSCSDEEYVEMALDELDKLVSANRPPKRKALLEQRLKSLISLAEEENVVKKAEKLIRDLRVFS